jgi:hypothetical protein
MALALKLCCAKFWRRSYFAAQKMNLQKHNGSGA